MLNRIQGIGKTYAPFARGRKGESNDFYHIVADVTLRAEEAASSPPHTDAPLTSADGFVMLTKAHEFFHETNPDPYAAAAAPDLPLIDEDGQYLLPLGSQPPGAIVDERI